MEPKSPAWKSIYTCSISTSKQHKNSVRGGVKYAASADASKPGGRRICAENVSTSAASSAQASCATAPDPVNTSHGQSSSIRKNSSRSGSTRSAAAVWYKPGNACSDSLNALQSVSLPYPPSRTSTPLQQPALDTVNNFVQCAAVCNSGTGQAPISTSCSKRLASPPPALLQSKPVIAQPLSPYLALSPLTARHPRSPACPPRPSSPLSGLSRAAQSTDSTATTTTIPGSSACTGSIQTYRTGLRPSSGTKRLCGHQQKNRSAAFRIQVSYGPRPASVAATGAAAAAHRVAHGLAGTFSDGGAAATAEVDPAAAAAPAPITVSPAGVEGDGETPRSSCSFDDHCDEPVKEELGMMLSEYILQMHTTPVACNSVSGLGDESDLEDNGTTPGPSSMQHYSNNSSILTSWGMQAAPPATAQVVVMFPAGIKPGTLDCLDDTSEVIAASTSSRSSTKAAGQRMEGQHDVWHTAIGSPFAAASTVVQQGSAAQPYSTCRTAHSDVAQDRGQQMLVPCSNNSFSSGSSAEDVTLDTGFDPSGCTPDADIIGSGASSSSLTLEDVYPASALRQEALRNTAATAMQRLPSADTAAAGQPGSSSQHGTEAATASTRRPQSSTGRRGVHAIFGSQTKELPPGRKPSGFLMASANSLDLRPATASESACSSRSSAPGTAAADMPSSRGLSGCQQQRSFTDPDSNADGFVKEVSLGHLSSSLFTATGADAGIRVPLQLLWGSSDIAAACSSFSSRPENQQQKRQQQQKQPQPGDEDSAEAPADRQDSCPQWQQQHEQQQEQQQQQHRASNPLKARSSPKSQQSACSGGFLQRLQGEAGSAWIGSSTGDNIGDCSWAAAVTGLGQPIPRYTAATSCTPAMTAITRLGIVATNVDADIADFPADDVSTTATIKAACGAKKTSVSSLGPGSEAGVVLQAWGAPASRPASHRSTNYVGPMQRQANVQQAHTQDRWAVSGSITSGRRAVQAATGAAVGNITLASSSAMAIADKQQQLGAAAAAAASSGSMHSQTLSSTGVAAVAQLQGQCWNGRLQGQRHQQQLVHRPPSRQKPPAESLHLFTSFLDKV